MSIPNLNAIKDWCLEKFTLNPASASSLGGIKVGSGLSVTQDGTLSASIPSATENNLGVVKLGSGLELRTGGTDTQVSNRFDHSTMDTRFDINRSDMSFPYKIGTIGFDGYGEGIKDVYATAFLWEYDKTSDGMVQTAVNHKIAIHVRDIISHNVVINDGIIKGLSDFQGSRLFVYADNAGLYIPMTLTKKGRVAVKSIIYYTEPDETDTTGVKLLNGVTDKTITKNGITISVSSLGSISISGKATATFAINSEHTGETGDDVLPAITLQYAPRMSQLYNTKHVSDGGVTLSLYDQSGNRISQSIGGTNIYCDDFVTGTESEPLSLSGAYLSFSFTSGHSYNVTFSPQLISKSEYV